LLYRHRIIFLFLRDWRATIISGGGRCGIADRRLCGDLGSAGFRFNNSNAAALVLATGAWSSIDAIVVLGKTLFAASAMKAGRPRRGRLSVRARCFRRHHTTATMGQPSSIDFVLCRVQAGGTFQPQFGLCWRSRG